MASTPDSDSFPRPRFVTNQIVNLLHSQRSYLHNVERVLNAVLTLLSDFQCSKTCGNGIKTRSVDCYGHNSQCDVQTRPSSRTVCNLGPCAQWKAGDWQQVMTNVYCFVLCFCCCFCCCFAWWCW